MSIVFNVYKSVAKKIIDRENLSLENMEGYAYEMLLPLYKVCEGQAGKIIPGRFKTRILELFLIVSCCIEFFCLLSKN